MPPKSKKDLPKATHYGVLGQFNNLQCYVTEEGQRLLSSRGIQVAMGIQSDSGSKLVRIASTNSLNPFVSKGLLNRLKSPLQFVTHHGGKLAHGYAPEILVDLCCAIIDADNAGKLHPQQKHLVGPCWDVVKAVSKVGIISLIDEATGYQTVRPDDALQKFLAIFLRETIRPWEAEFPDELWVQIARLKKWQDWQTSPVKMR